MRMLSAVSRAQLFPDSVSTRTVLDGKVLRMHRQVTQVLFLITFVCFWTFKDVASQSVFKADSSSYYIALIIYDPP